MPIDFENTELTELTPKIAVFGIGGAGCNAVNNMIAADLQGVDFIVANTDVQALDKTVAPTRLQLGGKLTKGLGAGANPEIGRQAALEDTDKIIEVLEGSDMVLFKGGQPLAMFKYACHKAGIDFDKINAINPGGAADIDQAFRDGQGQ